MTITPEMFFSFWAGVVVGCLGVLFTQLVEAYNKIK
jgi:hypothetical protein